MNAQARILIIRDGGIFLPGALRIISKGLHSVARLRPDRLQRCAISLKERGPITMDPKTRLEGRFTKDMNLTQKARFFKSPKNSFEEAIPNLNNRPKLLIK